LPASGIIALTIIGAYVLLCAIALWKYAATDAIKVIVALTGFFGAPLGAIGTYYFARNEITAARADATTAHNMAAQANALLASVSKAATQAKTQLVETIDSKPSTYTVGELKADSGYKNAVIKLDSAGIVYGFDVWGPKGEKAEQKK
jgi:hypothetical protein